MIINFEYVVNVYYRVATCTNYLSILVYFLHCFFVYYHVLYRCREKAAALLKQHNNTFNNKQYCQSFMDEANITRVYLTKYDTTSLKSKIKTDESDDISRAFELYVNYMPTFTNSAASKTGYYRIIVEIKHDNVDSDKEDAYYYTYANIEVR